MSLMVCHTFKNRLMLLSPFLPLISNKIKQAFGQIRFSDIAAIKELSINKGNQHFIFKFLHKFT